MQCTARANRGSSKRIHTKSSGPGMHAVWKEAPAGPPVGKEALHGDGGRCGGRRWAFLVSLHRQQARLVRSSSGDWPRRVQEKECRALLPPGRCSSGADRGPLRFLGRAWTSVEVQSEWENTFQFPRIAQVQRLRTLFQRADARRTINSSGSAQAQRIFVGGALASPCGWRVVLTVMPNTVEKVSEGREPRARHARGATFSAVASVFCAKSGYKARLWCSKPQMDIPPLPHALGRDTPQGAGQEYARRGVQNEARHRQQSATHTKMPGRRAAMASSLSADERRESSETDATVSSRCCCLDRASADRWSDALWSRERHRQREQLPPKLLQGCRREHPGYDARASPVQQSAHRMQKGRRGTGGRDRASLLQPSPIRY